MVELRLQGLQKMVEEMQAFVEEKEPSQRAVECSAKIKAFAFDIIQRLAVLLQGIGMTVHSTGQLLMRGTVSFLGGLLTLNKERFVFGIVDLLSAPIQLVAGSIISAIAFFSVEDACSVAKKVKHYTHSQEEVTLALFNPDSNRERFVSVLERIVGIVFVPFSCLVQCFIEIARGKVVTALGHFGEIFRDLPRLYGMPCIARADLRSFHFAYSTATLLDYEPL